MAAQFENDTIELKGLDQLLKALKAKPPQIKIGVLGNTSRAPKHGDKKIPSNATIAAVHEFGAPGRNIPQRSFLRIPITENLNKELAKSGLINEDHLKEVIKQGSILPWAESVAVVALGIVDDAFETQGNGKWPGWSNPNYTNEGGTLLVDTGQLRQSITKEVTA